MHVPCKKVADFLPFDRLEDRLYYQTYEAPQQLEYGKAST
jgi:hypothetical protein